MNKPDIKYLRDKTNGVKMSLIENDKAKKELSSLLYYISFLEKKVNNSVLDGVIYTHCTCTIPSLNYGGGKKECNKCGKVPNCI
jgi:hypothetical protein